LATSIIELFKHESTTIFNKVNAKNQGTFHHKKSLLDEFSKKLKKETRCQNEGNIHS
jgi:hypothetical protein